MEAESVHAVHERPKLRWYQWRLRSLFLLTLLVAIGMSWLAAEMQDQRKQKAAADAMAGKQGWAHYRVTWLGSLLVCGMSELRASMTLAVSLVAHFSALTRHIHACILIAAKRFHQGLALAKAALNPSSPVVDVSCCVARRGS
jgi:cytochrome bd-type quinol oxidase subunit 2